MNIIDRYDLNMGSANLTKLENTKRQYQNNISKFSLDTEDNKIVEGIDKNFKKFLICLDYRKLGKIFKDLFNTLRTINFIKNI